MKKTAGFISLTIASLFGGTALLGLGASPAGAASPVNISTANPGVISVGTGTVPGAYLEVQYALNSEGVPPVNAPAPGVLVITLGKPGQGIYGVVTF